MLIVIISIFILGYRNIHTELSLSSLKTSSSLNILSYIGNYNDVLLL